MNAGTMIVLLILLCVVGLVVRKKRQAGHAEAAAETVAAVMEQKNKSKYTRYRITGGFCMSFTKTVPFFCVRTVSYRLEANKSCSNFL